MTTSLTAIGTMNHRRHRARTTQLRLRTAKSANGQATSNGRPRLHTASSLASIDSGWNTAIATISTPAPPHRTPHARLLKVSPTPTRATRTRSTWSRRRGQSLRPLRIRSSRLGDA
eukprot:6210833-Pleurochrysis_carterae.AAC.1